MRTALPLLVAVLVAGVAQAQLPTAEQKCIDRYNNGLRKVAQQAGKSARTCLRNAARGSEPDPETCVVANGDGKLAGKEQKVADLFASGGACDPLPPVIVQGVPTGTAAHRGAVTDLVHDFFGAPIGPVSTAAGDGKCLDRAVQRSTQALTEIIKAQRKCKKTGLKAGSVTDEASLTAACGTLAQIDTAGKVSKRLLKLDGDVQTHCATTASGLAALFDGLDAGCHASPAALSACLQARSRCRACQAIATADGLAMDCDAFDDDSANFSCAGPVDLGTHSCTLGAGSTLNATTQGLPLLLHPSAILSIACGTTAADGTAPCTCSIDTFAAQVIPAIGDVCFNPYAGCPAGEIDCNGGSALDTQFAADHDLGTCSGQADCQATCDTFCGGLGLARSASGCEGFCQGGGNDGAACTADSDCPAGDCTGEAAFHGNTCNCACSGSGLGGAGGAGDLACNLGMQVNVELPSNGICGDGATGYSLPPVCSAMTTTTAVGQLNDANRTTGKTLPPVGFGGTLTGAGIDCTSLAASSTSGLTLVGHIAWFDTTFGDFFSANTFVCQ